MTKPIGNSRLETFCDGIYAIAITLLILEIKAPEIGNIHSAQELKHDLLLQWPSWFAFLLTFLTLFISWVNHLHMIALLNKTSNTFIYANGFLMLTVVVFPFSTMLLGRYINTEFSTLPVVLYCFNTFYMHLPGQLFLKVRTNQKICQKMRRVKQRWWQQQKW